MPGKLRRLIAAAAVVVGVAGGITGCSGKAGPAGSDVDNAIQGPNDSQTFFTAGHRQTAGDVHGTTLNGAPISLSQYRGKWVVVNFWSVACGPCHDEEPAFEEASKEDASKGVQFVGVDERDNLDAAKSFAANYHMTYPSIYDRNDAFTLDFPGAAPSTTPFTIVLDPQGQIAAKASVAMDLTHLRAFIKRVTSDAA